MKKIFTSLFILLVFGASAQTVNVTLSVNMMNETVDPAGVFVAGGADFGLPGDNPMDDSDGDGVWELTFVLDQGYTGNYTFTNGACPDFQCKENIVGLPCADGPFSDRLLSNIQNDTTITTCFAQCSTDGTCEIPLEPVDVTFRVDMTDNPPTGPVFVFGNTINGWIPSATPMDDSDGDLIYEVTVEDLPQGASEYKFVNDTSEEIFDPMTDDSLCTLTSGQFTNRFLFIDGPDDIVLDPVCFETCGECSGDPIVPVDVTFQVNMNNETILGPIYITGFALDGWNGTTLEMTDDDGDGVFQYTTSLNPGDYEYLFQNSDWPNTEQLNPTDHGDCTLTSGDFTNRLVTVPDGAGTLIIEPFCFGTCDICTVGLTELEETAFSLSPNITSDFTNLQFAETLNETRIVRIYNTSGLLVDQLLIKSNASNYELDLTDLSTGLYLINVEAKGVNTTKKLVITK